MLRVDALREFAEKCGPALQPIDRRRVGLALELEPHGGAFASAVIRSDFQQAATRSRFLRASRRIVEEEEEDTLFVPAIPGDDRAVRATSERRCA